MRLKKIMLAALLLLAIMTIGVASATDGNSTSDLTVSEDLSVESQTDMPDDVLSTDDGTFSDLSTLIENTSSGDTLELDKDYYQNEDSEEITISDTITIDGKGHIINTIGKSHIFWIENAPNVTLKNIVFKYKNGNELSYRAIMFYECENATIVNCSFINCTSYDEGGAIYFGSSNSNLINCSFINCTSTVDSGGAVYFEASNNNIINCSFVNCSSKGTIYYESVERPDGKGGAVYFEGTGNTVSACEFINCSSTMKGGAIYIDYIYGDDCYIIDCRFINCSSSDNYSTCEWNFEGAGGGAIYCGADNCNVINCNFSYCTDYRFSIDTYMNYGEAYYDYNGGAIDFGGSNCNIIGCIIANCSLSEDRWDSICLEGENCQIANTSFYGGSLVSRYQVYISNCTIDNNEFVSIFNNKGNPSQINLTENHFLYIDETIQQDNVVIEGNGHNIENYYNNRLLTISGENVTLKNLILKDIKISATSNGCTFMNCSFNADARFEGDDCNLINCIFQNRSSTIEFNGDNGNVINCTFINCSDYGSAGAIGIGGENCRVINSEFVNCRCGESGGAICYSDNTSIINSSFINCTTYYGHDAIYGRKLNLINSTFTGCSFDHGEQTTISNVTIDGIEYLNIFDNLKDNISIVLTKDYEILGPQTIAANNVIIDGNGAVIDSRYIGILYLEGQNITIKNLTLNRISIGVSSYGYDLNTTIIDCNFVNCSRSNRGSAIDIKGINNIINCSFINCFGPSSSGAIDVSGNNIGVIGCSFINCSSAYRGGAISIDGENNSVINCSFINCSAEDGGAIYWYGESGIVNNASFKYCQASKGGAVYWNGNNGIIENSHFTQFSAQNGPAVYVREDFENVTITSSRFENTNQTQLNNAVYGGTVFDNCNFTKMNETQTPSKPKLNTTTTVSTNSTELTLGGNISITVNVFDQNDEAIEGTVDVYINSTFIGTKNIAEPFTYTPTHPGIHLIEVNFNGDSNYNGSSNGTSFIVDEVTETPEDPDNTTTKNESRTTVFINIANIYLGNSISITAMVSNSNNEIIAGTVDVYINSTFIGTKNIAEPFTYTPSELGKHNIEARFNEDSAYNASSGKASFNVITPIVKEEISSDDSGIILLEFPINATGTLTVYIDGKPVKEINVTEALEQFKKQTQGDVLDIVIGILKIDLSQYKGKYTITFVYSGDENYEGFTIESNVTVNNKNPIITANNMNTLYTAGPTYTIMVFEDEGVAANGAQVIVDANGKRIATLTAKNGIASFKVSQTPGTYRLTITSLGKTIKRTLAVKHVVTLKTVKVKKSAKKLVLTATLAKVNKKYLKNKKITFKFNGKKYTAKTNKKGVAKVTVKSSVLKKLKVGKKVTYQAAYLKDTVKKTVKVKK